MLTRDSSNHKKLFKIEAYKMLVSALEAINNTIMYIFFLSFQEIIGGLGGMIIFPLSWALGLSRRFINHEENILKSKSTTGSDEKIEIATLAANGLAIIFYYSTVGILKLACPYIFVATAGIKAIYYLGVSLQHLYQARKEPDTTQRKQLISSCKAAALASTTQSLTGLSLLFILIIGTSSFAFLGLTSVFLSLTATYARYHQLQKEKTVIQPMPPAVELSSPAKLYSAIQLTPPRLISGNTRVFAQCPSNFADSDSESASYTLPSTLQANCLTEAPSPMLEHHNHH